jgi:hypothetical protein
MGKLHIMSRSSQPFSDRKEAGILLGNELKKLELERENARNENRVIEKVG